jgi:hypothetical protein
MHNITSDCDDLRKPNFDDVGTLVTITLRVMMVDGRIAPGPIHVTRVPHRGHKLNEKTAFRYAKKACKIVRRSS